MTNSDEAIDPGDLDPEGIIEGAARALFVSAYAAAAERAEEEGEEFEGDRAGPGEDWLDCAPDTPQAAEDSAKALLRNVASRVPGTYGESLAGLCADWIQAGGTGDRFGGPEFVFGFYLAMEALGHGVGLSDDLPPGNGYKSPKTPHWETDYYGGEFQDCR